MFTLEIFFKEFDMVLDYISTLLCYVLYVQLVDKL